MAKRLFSCSSSNIEEIDYFYKVMEENNIECYDVPGSAFGLSKPSLWIRNDEDFPKAKSLFKEHEHTYAALAREKYQQETGYNPDATGKEKWNFFLKNLYEKRALLPFIILGFIFLYWYFSEFFEIFLQN